MTTSKVRDPAGWDIETLIEAVGALDAARRTAALAVFAHHLTVEMRAVLDGPFPEPGLAQVRQLNEFLHQLTSRLHPAEGRSAEDDKLLLDALAVDAARVGLETSLKRGLMIAVRNSLATAKRRVPAL